MITFQNEMKDEVVKEGRRIEERETKQETRDWRHYNITRWIQISKSQSFNYHV